MNRRCPAVNRSPSKAAIASRSTGAGAFAGRGRTAATLAASQQRLRGLDGPGDAAGVQGVNQSGHLRLGTRQFVVRRQPLELAQRGRHGPGGIVQVVGLDGLGQPLAQCDQLLDLVADLDSQGRQVVAETSPIRSPGCGEGESGMESLNTLPPRQGQTPT